MAGTFESLTSMSVEDLIAEYDQMAPGTAIGLGFMRDELHRRQMERSASTMQRLTWWVFWLTVINVILVGYTIFG